MAGQNFLHTAEIMKAAAPYIETKYRVMVELVTKVFDLMGSIQAFAESKNLAACGYQDDKTNIEGLLNAIRPLCDEKERALVDQILGFYNAKRMFEMYNNVMSTMKTVQDSGVFNFGDTDNSTGQGNDSSNFSGFNFDSIFGNGNNSSTVSDAGFHTDSDNETDVNTGNSSDLKSDSEKNPSADSSQSQTDSGKNSMLDMLKAMVPPEQMSTFENLSMLLNSMSYDNNKKSDDSKER